MPGSLAPPSGDPPSPSPSHWHQINPSTRPLNLQILELTPLSLTLSLALLGPGKQLRGLKQHQQSRRRRRSDDEVDEASEASAAVGGTSGVPGSFKHLLSHGVVVTVNGQAWSRIVAHVAEAQHDESASTAEGSATSVPKDRAVVVVYGLLPGLEYEVELRVVGLPLGGGEDEVGIASTTVLIPPGPTGSRSRANSLRSRSHPRSRSNSASHPIEHSTLVPPSPQPLPAPQTVDAQAAHLRHLVSATNAEREGLLAQIKETRRASQRAEAALRQEVETIKKSSEKLSAADLRARQKTLALQEQVKQAWAASELAEQETQRVDQSMGQLEEDERAVAREVEGVEKQVKASDEIEDAARERDRIARAEADKTLTDITNKVEKLRVKRDKRQSEREELEKKLADLIHQREEHEGRNEMEMQRRRMAGQGHYGGISVRPGWDDPTWQVGYPAHQERSLSAQPSLNHLSAAAQASAAYRPRVGGSHFQARYPSPAITAPVIIPGGRPPTSSVAAPVGSPTHGGLYRPPTQQRSASNPGVNVAAPPFHPTFSGPNTESHTTPLVPPQLQHRIYLPSVRPPRPTPTFQPPPGVASQLASSNSSSAGHSDEPPTAFPPLPSQHQVAATSVSPVAKASNSTGPSLASIVTRAVLSPHSGVLNQTPQSSSASSSSGGNCVQSRRASYQRPSPPPSNSGSSGPPSRQQSTVQPAVQSPLSPTFATSPGHINQTPKGNPAMPSRIWGVQDEFPALPVSPGTWGTGSPWPGSVARMPTPPVEEYVRRDE